MTSPFPPPGPNPGQPYPPQLPGLYPGHGVVRVHIQGNEFTSNLIVPSLLLDGRPVASRYGENAYQVPAGRHRVELYAQWLRRYGQAALDVQVSPGAATDVHYAAPWHQFTTGSIGLVPQSRKGKGWLVGVIVAMVVVFALMLLPLLW